MNWHLHPASPDQESDKKRLGLRFDLPPLILDLLFQRGLTTEDGIRRFLHGTLADLPNPFLLPDMDRATERLLKAISKKEKILFFGDYDVDGITGTAQLQSYFRALGLPTRALLPHRMHEGYGLTEKSVKKIAVERPDLLVTIDNGTKAREEISFLKSKGIDVIVIDHHETPTADCWPPVEALVNPKRTDSAFSERDIASAGLVFLLLMALRARCREQGVGSQLNLKRYLDLACLGTIADIVPMTGTNRLLAKFGLEEIGLTARPGLKALCANAGVSGAISTDSVAFRLAPRINAAGRLADPKIALDLLLAENDAEAYVLAAQLENLNRERQTLEEKVTKEAIALIEREQADHLGLVAAGTDWHLGVVGIVAAKLTEKFGKPAVVLSISEDGREARGSARSVPGFSVYAPLKKMEDHMVRFGGHAAAAGMTVAMSSLKSFTERFNEEVRSLWTGSRRQSLLIDAPLPLRDINSALVKHLSFLQPHGPENPEPLFLADSVRLEGCRLVGQANKAGRGGKGHLKAVLCEAGIRLDGIGFNQGGFLERIQEDRLHQIAYTPHFNEWNGILSIQAKIKAIFPTH